MSKKLVIVSIVLLNFVYAQSSSDNTTQQIWADYNPQWDLERKLYPVWFSWWQEP